MKTTIQSILFIFFFVFLSFLSNAQETGIAYEEAKRHFKVGDYGSAMLAFSSLTNDAVYGNYATFYYGLSAYKRKEYQVSVDSWKQILTREPNWNQIHEVNYWISQAALKTNNTDDFFKYSRNLDENWRCHHIKQLMNGIGLSKQKSLYIKYKDKCSAKELFNTMTNIPNSQRDNKLFDELIYKFGFKNDSFSGQFPYVRKDKYALAVLLPFMFESLNNSNSVLANTIILDLYQGMKYGQKQVDNIELFPYDTKKSFSVTQKLIDDGKLKNADVIIGPLLEEPFHLVSKFSKENKIPFINPVTSKNSFLDENQYVLLLNASYETQGIELGKYLVKNCSDKKKTMIFFENERDKIIAGACFDVLKKSGFDIMRYEPIDKTSAREFQRELTDTYKETKKNNLTSESYIKNTLRVENGYVDNVIAITSNNTIANSFINVVETRPDTINLVGLDSWLDFRLSSFEQIQRLKINLVGSCFFDETTDNYNRFKKDFIANYKIDPSKYHLIGYELIMQLSELLENYGKYIQRGLGEGNSKITGKLMNNLLYNGKKDNQIVPILKVEDFEVINDNKE